MAATITIWTAANLFIGDDGPDNSKHLSLQNIKLPDWKEKSQEHHPGGGIAAINIGGLGFEAPELSFKLVGTDAQAKAAFGLGSRVGMPYTIYGELVDKRTARKIERKVVVFGRMTEVSEDEFERGKVTMQDHKITEITHFELYEDKKEVYFFDLWTSQWRVNGIDENAETRGILRIA